MAILELIDLLGVRKRAIVFHPPNGGLRSVVTGAKMKRLGALAGVFDLIFLTSEGSFCLEVKIPGGKGLNKNQKLFAAECERLWIPHGVARTTEQARDTLISWGLADPQWKSKPRTSR